jgi:uncharacterized C2H2 Zn-finger protein
MHQKQLHMTTRTMVWNYESTVIQNTVENLVKITRKIWQRLSNDCTEKLGFINFRQRTIYLRHINNPFLFLRSQGHNRQKRTSTLKLHKVKKPVLSVLSNSIK